MPHDQAFSALARISVESVWKALYDRGFKNCFIGGLQVIHPHLRMVGRARTVRFVPYRPDLAKQLAEEPQLNKQVVEESQPNDVLVVDAFGFPAAGFAGDIILTRFKQRGGAGVVVDGAVRDLQFLRGIDLPLYTRHANAAAIDQRVLGLESQVPVQVAGVCVLPGDYLLGDAAGVLVIPAGLVDQVVAEALEMDHKESFIRRKLEEDASLHDTYPPNDPLGYRHPGRVVRPQPAVPCQRQHHND